MIEVNNTINTGVQNVLRKANKVLNKQLEDAFIEGLKRKGFEFQNREDLGDFIKKRCRCETDVHQNNRLYFVDDIPFFQYFRNNTVLPKNKDLETNNYEFTASLGTYKYC